MRSIIYKCHLHMRGAWSRIVGGIAQTEIVPASPGWSSQAEDEKSAIGVKDLQV